MSPLPRVGDPHHDGSALYVPDQEPALDGTVDLFVRTPHGAHVSRVALRSPRDGEPRFVEAVVDRRTERETWWRVALPLPHRVVSYRFLLDGGRHGYRWLNGAGVVGHDPTDAHDFRVTTHRPPPAWAVDATVYQVLPDRFADSGRVRDWPDWAVRAGWDDAVGPRGPAARQLYGGDLAGVEARLDHVQELGADAVYLTPFFPARSHHRYDATSFDVVDPLLGGDAALVSLRIATHARGMRLIGDLVPNHTGDRHVWFLAAQADAAAPEARFYHFRRHPDDYESWLGHRTLPTLDQGNAELRDRLYEAPDAVVARWLRPPFALDGWRIDVANMVGRRGPVDRNREVARAIRQAVERANPDALVVAEHGFDASAELGGDGWHGVMAYAGFTRPAWTWLVSDAGPSSFLGVPTPVPRLPGSAAARTMTEFRAAIPWRSATHSLNLLGSHDTPRIRTVTGDRERQLVGAALLFTTPGIPMVFAGDEVGVEGHEDPDNRRPMPWDRTRWDAAIWDGYRRLARVRREHPALRRGGFRWVHVDDDVLVYLREAAAGPGRPGDRVLVQLARTSHAPVRLPAAGLDLREPGVPLLGGEPLVPSGGLVTLPTDGPAAHLWLLP